MYKKIIQSGNLIEQYVFEKNPDRHFRGRNSGKRGRYRKGIRRRRVQDVKACRRAFMRLVRSSISTYGAPAFLTLTIYDVVSVRQSYKRFTSFFSRFVIKYPDVRYVAVPEIQKRGAVHFHCLVWGIPDNVVRQEKKTRYIQNLWFQGYCDIIATDGSPKLIGYLAKYLTKHMSDSRGSGEKAYTCSRKMPRPSVFNSEKSPYAVSLIEEMLVDKDVVLIKDLNYNTEWLGRANYKSYLLPF